MLNGFTCQFKMDDIDVNADDHHISKELNKTYMHYKTHLPFTNMQELKDCRYLGGNYLFTPTIFND